MMVWHMFTESSATVVPLMTGGLKHQTLHMKVQTPQEPQILQFLMG